jgi:hypothetical protein
MRSSVVIPSHQHMKGSEKTLVPRRTDRSALYWQYDNFFPPILRVWLSGGNADLAAVGPMECGGTLYTQGVEAATIDSQTDGVPNPNGGLSGDCGMVLYGQISVTRSSFFILAPNPRVYF